MSILFNPTFDPASIYRPVVWIVQSIIDTTTLGPIKKAKATVTVDGSIVKIVTKSPFDSSGPVVAKIYAFQFDIQAILQRLKAPKAQSKSLCFGAVGAAYSALAADCYGNVQVDFEYFYDDNTTGLRTNQGVLDSSVTQDFLIATRQHEDSMSLAAYIPLFASFAPFLTNSATTQNICLSESLFISTIASTGNAVRIITYDSAGVQIDLGVFSAPGSANEQLSFGIGPNEIRNTVFDLAGSVNIDNPLAVSYTVAYGAGAIFFEYTAVYTFNIVNCCDGVRLHWLNRLGGTDAYTFKALNETQQETKSEVAQTPLSWDFLSATPHNINDKGSFKIDSRANITRTLESTPVASSVANWLAELASSPEVYLETSNGLVPVLIGDLEQKIDTNNSTGLMLVNFNLTSPEANERIIQRN